MFSFHLLLKERSTFVINLLHVYTLSYEISLYLDITIDHLAAINSYTRL